MAQPDSAWFEAQYNNRARVPEAVQILPRWAEASTLARSRMTVLPDLAYGGGPGETLDVFPARAPGAPVLVFIHGGYWRALDKSDHSFVAPSFVQAGAMVVVPNYALCPVVGIEDIALQMCRALAWVFQQAERYGGDPTRIHLVGHSAGGHLASMLLCTRWHQVGPNLPKRLVAGALSLSGLFDLAPLRQAPFLQADLQLTEASALRLSPAGFPQPRGPLLALVGADESPEFIRQNQLIRQRWGAKVVPVCEALPGLNHFTVMHDLVDAAGGAHRHALQLLGLAAV